ncbi:MAG: glycosyltransferase family 2 protein [Ignavibacteriaceae bacterium]|nr:glycosyltransferase family 2 protein [Ignavibacteriaceae bacterium]
MLNNKKLVVIIPVFNEEDSIASVIKDIPGFIDEIVVVNNGSRDRTSEIASNAGATVLTEIDKGYGAACLKGIDYIKNKNYEIVVFLDGDFSDHPCEMGLVIDPIIKDDYDLVIGSRLLGQREKGAMLPQAIFGNWLSCFLIRLFWGYRFSDLGPFRAITYCALQKLDMKDRNFGWTVEMQIKAAKQKLRAIEVPVSYRKRIGISKVTGTISGTVKASVKILWLIFMSLNKSFK